MKFFFSRLVWSPCKTWSFLILRARMYSSSQKFWGTMGVAPLFKAKQAKQRCVMGVGMCLRRRAWMKHATLHVITTNFVIKSNPLGAYMFGIPIIRKSWLPLVVGRVWYPRNTLLPHMYYHTKFCHSRSHRLGVGTESQKILVTLWAVPLGRWHTCPTYRNTQRPHVLSPNFIPLGQTIWA